MPADIAAVPGLTPGKDIIEYPQIAGDRKKWTREVFCIRS